MENICFYVQFKIRGWVYEKSNLQIYLNYESFYLLDFIFIIFISVCWLNSFQVYVNIRLKV